MLSDLCSIFLTAPSLNNTPLRILEKDDVLELIAQQKVIEDDIKWINVRLENGEEGWVSSSSKYVNEYQYTGHTGVVKTSTGEQESPLQIRAQKWSK